MTEGLQSMRKDYENVPILQPIETSQNPLLLKRNKRGSVDSGAHNPNGSLNSSNSSSSTSAGVRPKQKHPHSEPTGSLCWHVSIVLSRAHVHIHRHVTWLPNYPITIRDSRHFHLATDPFLNSVVYISFRRSKCWIWFHPFDPPYSCAAPISPIFVFNSRMECFCPVIVNTIFSHLSKSFPSTICNLM